ncbi:hypothetical protein ACJMK2_011497 [Sinanodonta woodiana]|uniref:Calponin-homology (CH) domain-containing protein n=1 Tax=Sinanodonta woodiana TaxID=1069815 RepID=A0ABD3V8B2_SINWO
MTDYTKYTDEDELHQILQKSEDIEERRKIRARIKELRETHQKEWEQKRQQREKETEDVIRQKHRAADEEKQRKMEEFKKQAAEHRDSRAHEISSQLVQEKFKSAEEDKKKKMEAFDRMAQESTSVTTSTRTESTKDGVKTTTTTVRKTETVGGVGGTSYGKPAEETARELVQKLASFSSPTTSGTITVKTESWNSREAVIHKSEKIESWGAGRGASGNMFKQMDKATGGGAPKANITRSPSAIKQLLLDWTKAMTREYTEKVNIENFSTSWNDGLAFCALIHHFYPEAFDFNKLDPKNRRHNFELAFNTAEKFADIAPLLDVEDMVRMKKPDWKCVFTYVQSFYRKLQSHENNKVKPIEQ